MNETWKIKEHSDEKYNAATDSYWGFSWLELQTASGYEIASTPKQSWGIGEDTKRRLVLASKAPELLRALGEAVLILQTMNAVAAHATPFLEDTIKRFEALIWAAEDDS